MGEKEGREECERGQKGWEGVGRDIGVGGEGEGSGVLGVRCGVWGEGRAPPLKPPVPLLPRPRRAKNSPQD